MAKYMVNIRRTRWNEMAGHRLLFMTFFGPCISPMSFWLSLSIPARNLPIVGAPTDRCLRTWLSFFTLANFSRIMPFSIASFLRTASFSAVLAAMPFLCDIGIFCCAQSDVFEPRSCRRMSTALCLLRPTTDSVDCDSSRCDSLSRRCRARSFLRLAASETASSGSGRSIGFLLNVGG